MNIKQICVFSLILFLLSNCKKEVPEIVHEKPSMEIDSSYFEILKMLEHNENTVLKFNRDYFPDFKSDYSPTHKETKVDSMVIHYYKILFRGHGNRFFDEITSYDSINYIPYFEDYRLQLNTGYSMRKLRELPSFNLTVFVDTTQFIKNPIQYYPKIDKGDEYPVYLINQSNQWHFKWLANMSLTIIMEAYHKENRQWQSIEYQTTHGGLYMVLAPESYVVTSAPVYDGDYATRMRLRYKDANGITYSNEFHGKINKSQFDTISMLNRDNLSVFHF